MNRYIKKFHKVDPSLTPIIAVVLVILIVLSVSAVVMLWGKPYIERLRANSAREDVKNQLKILSEQIEEFAKSGSGTTTTSISVDEGLISIDKGDRINVWYSLDDNYNFSVTGLDDNDKEFYINYMQGSKKVTRAEIYGLGNPIRSSLLKGTKILMADGSYKDIEEIKSGDRVKSFDFERNEIVDSKVVDVIRHDTQNYVVINGIKVTPNHLIYTKNGWIKARDVKISDKLLSDTGYVEVRYLRNLYNENPIYTYDLIVEKYHNYFIKSDRGNFLVHNAYIHVISPNGGEKWYKGESYYITWESEGIGNTVKIGLLKDGKPYELIAGQTDNDGIYSWIIPDYLPTSYNYQVAVSTLDDKIYDVSDGFFIIEDPPITVTSPNGGEEWKLGSTQTITWSLGPDHGSLVEIQLWKNDQYHDRIASSVDENQGYYKWSIPRNYPPGDDYKIKIIELDGTGYSDSSDSYFSLVSPSPPSVTTKDATNIGSTSATLNGYLNDMGDASSCKVRFVYDTSSHSDYTQYRYSTSNQTMNNVGSFSETLEGLRAGITYYFRAVASSEYGTSQGGEKSFTTSSTPPSVTTNDATNIGSTSATLNGHLDSMGTASSVTVYFEWGTDTNYGHTTTPQIMTSTGDFYFNLEGLTPGTTYHYRAVAVGDGTTYGSDKSFTTTTTPPSVTTNDATNIGSTSATLNGHLDSMGTASSVTVYFEWGTDTSYGHTTDSQTMTSTGDFSFTLDNLDPYTTYHYRAVATSEYGTDYGDDKTFTTNQLTIRVVSPNGGEHWGKNMTYNITWDGTNWPMTGIDVTIKLYKGGNYLKTIASGVYIWSYSYSWTVDEYLETGDDYVIKISAIKNNKEISNDTSNDTFSIVNPITVISPAAGDTWSIGSTHTIRWQSADGFDSQVGIGLIKGGDLDHPFVISSGTENDGSYDWTIPPDEFIEPNGNDYQIVISNLDRTLGGASGMFTITPEPTITITSPTGGEIWLVNKTYAITWEISGDINEIGTSLSILLKNDYNNFEISIAENVKTSDGSYNWHINPSYNIPPDTHYYIYIQTSNNKDDTSNNFSIDVLEVKVPNGNETWQRGRNYIIEWNGNWLSGVITNVSIYLYKGDSLYRTIADKTLNDGGESWIIPEDIDIGDDYKIKISTTDGKAFDFSDDYFSIIEKASLNITSPNGGEHWQQGLVYNITWECNGDAGSISIKLFKDDKFYRALAYGVDSSKERWEWNITTDYDIGTKYKINITSSDGSISDMSDDYFSIVPYGSASLSYDPKSHDFGNMKTGETASTTFEIWNEGEGSIIFSITEDCDWVDVSPPIGSATSSNHATVTVTVNTTNLSLGQHTCNIYISSYDPDTNDPAGDGTFKVTVDITENLVLFYFPTYCSLDLYTGDVATAQFCIQNAGSGNMSYELTENLDWLSVNPENGYSNGEIDNITVTIDATGLPAGSYVGEIFITTNGGGNGKYTVYLDVEGPQIQITSPTGGDRWKIGNIYSIRWQSTKIGGNVSIELYEQRSQSPSYTIAEKTENDGTFSWYIPLDCDPGIYKIKITDVDNSSIYGFSDYFVIEELHKGTVWHETVGVSSDGRVVCNHNLEGTICIDLYNDNENPYQPVARIWVFDTKSIVYEFQSTNGPYKTIYEYGGMIYSDPAGDYVDTGLPISITNDFASLNIPQLRSSSLKLGEGAHTYKFDINLVIGCVREFGEVHNLKMQMFGDNSEIWIRYIADNYPFTRNDDTLICTSRSISLTMVNIITEIDMRV